jgi:hypothetical protein
MVSFRQEPAKGSRSRTAYQDWNEVYENTRHQHPPPFERLVRGAGGACGAYDWNGERMSKRQKTKTANAVHRSHCARLEFNHPCAGEVCIAGSFNDWHPAAMPMVSLGDGKWRKELTLPPGRYEYRFVVDGQWMDDPTAKETVPNPFGGFNAVLVVESA